MLLKLNVSIQLILLQDNDKISVKMMRYMYDTTHSV